MKYLRPILIFGTLAIILGVVIYLGRIKARKHVNYITAVEDHPLTCWTCHVYTQKDNFIAKMMNEVYISPYNLSISPDGNRLYVVAQESNQLIVVDPSAGVLLDQIDVGNRPHTVVLGQDNNTAFISNQWSDNIFVINLAEGRVTDTIVGGSGPAGMVISPDGHSLFVVNSYSSDISIFDMDGYKEKRRLKAGNNPVSAAISPDGSQVYVSSRRTLPVRRCGSPRPGCTSSRCIAPDRTRTCSTSASATD